MIDDYAAYRRCEGKAKREACAECRWDQECEGPWREYPELFGWDEDTFLSRTEGSAIRRIGYLRWLRNIAVALGNAPGSTAVIDALTRRASHPSALISEHVAWALARHREGAGVV